MQGRMGLSLAIIIRQRGLAWALALPIALLAVLLLAKPAAASDENPSLPGANVTGYYTETFAPPGANSYFDVSFSGIGQGYAVADGVVYDAWCVDPYSGPPPATGVSEQVRLYSTYDPALPQDLKQYQGVDIPWPKINWILNNKAGQPNNVVQPAIWYFITGQRLNWDQPGWGCAVGSSCDALVTQANNNPNFVPGPGQILAVVTRQNGILGTGSDGVATFDDGYQETIIEWTIPPTQVVVAKTAVTSYNRAYTWEIAKSVSPAVVNLFEGQNADFAYTVQVTRSAPVDSGFQVSGSIYVTNTGASSVQITSVDDVISGVANPAAVVCPTLPATLTAGQSLTCSYSAPLPDATSRTNTATVTYNSGLQQTGTAPVTFGAPTTVTNASVDVQDVYNGGAPETLGTGIVSDTTFATYQRNVVCDSTLNYQNGVASYQRANTASVIQSNQSGPSDSETVTVNCYRPSVSKTVDPDFTRRFTWQILKTVAPDQINLLDGQSASATYTVTLTKSDPIDENFRVFGTIVVTNPNPAAALQLTGVSDQLGSGQSAAVTCPATSVPAGSTLTCTYETNVPDSSDGTNTATITATTGIVYKSPVVPYTFVNVPPSQTVLNQVTVTDTNPATGQPWNFNSSGQVSYSLPFACTNVNYDQNGQYQTLVNNIAQIGETGQNSKATVLLTCTLPKATVSSVCVDGARTWSVLADQTGSYVVEFLVNGNVQSTLNLNLTANTASNFNYNGDPTTLSGVRITFNGKVIAEESGPYESCVDVPTASVSSTCVNDERVWTVSASQTGAYVVEFVTNGNVVQSTPVNLTANTPQQVNFNGDPTTLTLVRITFDGTTVGQENGPFASCAPPPPTAELTTVCTNNERTWTVTASQTGSFVAEFLINGTVVGSEQLNLVANTPQIFAYGGDPTTLTQVRITFGGTTVATLNGPFDDCAPTPPTGSVSSFCLNNVRVWTVSASQTGAYVVEFVTNGNVVQSTPVNLTANTPQQVNFNGDPTTLTLVRITFDGTTVGQENGPFASCAPTPPTGSVSSFCLNNVRVWTVSASQTGAYVVEFVTNGNVVQSTPVNLTANAPQQVNFNGDPTTLTLVRITFDGTTVGQENGPFASCAPETPTGSVSSFCLNNVRVWTVSASQTGAYVVEFVTNGNVVQSTPVNLTANTPQQVNFNGDPTTLTLVRITFDGTTVGQENGPFASCAPETPKVTLTSVCTQNGMIWQVSSTQSGPYVAQLVSGGNVVETVNLDLTANQQKELVFVGDSSTPNLVRIVYQGNVVVEQEGPEPCIVSGLSAALAPRCVESNGTIVWTFLSNVTGTYVAQLMSGSNVIESKQVGLVNGQDKELTFENESLSPRFVRLLFQGRVYAQRTGLTSCAPTSLPPSDEPGAGKANALLFLPALGR